MITPSILSNYGFNKMGVIEHFVEQIPTIPKTVNPKKKTLKQQFLPMNEKRIPHKIK